MTISYTARVVVPADTLINLVGDESVILNLKSERYFGLDKVGSRMWAVLTTSDSIQAAFETLLGEYNVEADMLGKDLNNLLEVLVQHELIELASEQNQ